MNEEIKVSLSLLPLRLMSMLFPLVEKMGKAHWLFDKMADQLNSPKQKRRAFANYSPTKEDLIVATYSKSGTNWGMQIGLQIAFLGEAKFTFIHDLIPWPDTLMPLLPAKLSDDSLASRSPTGMRVIKTHWEQDYVPYDPDAKYLIVVRDPKEVFVSSYHFAKGMIGSIINFPFTPNEWLDRYLSDRFFFGSWTEHIASWWSYRDRPNVLILRYDEMKRDPEGGVKQIADLMGVSLTEEQLAKVMHKSSFPYMQANETRFIPPIFKTDKKVMFRKGETGASSEMLSVAQQKEIDRFVIDELARLGSDFPYIEIFG